MEKFIVLVAVTIWQFYVEYSIMYNGMQTKVNIILFQYAVKDDDAHARWREK